jgi:heavy metal translocating P-type ATPase
MDTLISVGVLSAYLYSLVQMITGSLNVYFDTAAMLVTLVLLGKYIEARAREKVSGGMQELYRLANQKVRLRKGSSERWVSTEVVTPGEEFSVPARERIPLDGRIISGHGRVDESILTGESRPVKKSVGSDVMGGTLLLDGELSIKVTRVGRESSLGQLIGLVKQALSRKNPIELLADRVTRRFVPAILVLAAATAFWTWVQGASFDNALLRALAVLVISCPCALGIATPLAKVAAVGAGRMKGILIRDPHALEQAKDLDAVVFDKTGTMTEGSFSLKEVVSFKTSKEEALRRIAALEIHSDHFIAREILRKAEAVSLIEEEAHYVEELPGLGVKGIVDEMAVAVGNRPFLAGEGVSLPPSLDGKARRLESEGNTIVFFGWEGSAKGFLSFGDRVKPTARRVVQNLHSQGIATWLVSGDAPETTQAVAGALGIDQFLGQALPQEKVAIIKKLRDEGCRVGMVGDGFNDAAALAEADVGFAVGTGVNLAREASDITLLGHDPARLCEAIGLSALTMNTIRQNLAFAFLYNLLCIPLAVTGLVNPLVAVFAMFASSLTVVGNSSRILRRQESLASPLPLIPSTEPV